MFYITIITLVLRMQYDNEVLYAHRYVGARAGAEALSSKRIYSHCDFYVTKAGRQDIKREMAQLMLKGGEYRAHINDDKTLKTIEVWYYGEV